MECVGLILVALDMEQWQPLVNTNIYLQVVKF
jgi:hypothetical protein